MDGIPTNITMGDVVVSAIEGDVIEINGKNYKFGTIWTIFGTVADRIQITDFKVFTKCSTLLCIKKNQLGDYIYL